MDDTLCDGTLTVRLRPAGLLSTAAVKETATVSSTWKSVRRPALGRPKVDSHIHNYFSIGIESKQTNG